LADVDTMTMNLDRNLEISFKLNSEVNNIIAIG